MKYCEGGCRRKYIKHEGSAYGCKYHRGYVVDNKSDNKVFEICLKSNWIADTFRKILRTIFGDIIDVQDIRYGSRKSKSVERNQGLFGDHEKLL
jgi:hypothetical protein